MKGGTKELRPSTKGDAMKGDTTDGCAFAGVLSCVLAARPGTVAHRSSGTASAKHRVSVPEPSACGGSGGRRCGGIGTTFMSA